MVTADGSPCARPAHTAGPAPTPFCKSLRLACDVLVRRPRVFPPAAAALRVPVLWALPEPGVLGAGTSAVRRRGACTWSSQIRPGGQRDGEGLSGRMRETDAFLCD